MKCEFKQDAVASILAGCKKISGQRRREVNTRCQRVTCNWCKKQQPALILTHQESGVKVFTLEVSELKDAHQLSTYICCTRAGQRNWVTFMSSFCVVVGHLTQVGRTWEGQGTEGWRCGGCWGDSTDNIWVSHVQCAVKLDFMPDSNCQSSRPCKDMTNMTNIVDHNDNHHYQDDDPHQLWFVKCISALAPQVQPSEAGWSCLGGLPLPPQRHNRRHHRQSYNHPQCQSSRLKVSGRKYSTEMFYIIQK